MYILTGASSAGKTALLERLRKVLPDERYACHDIEEQGVPDGAGDWWRADQAEKWLRTATENASSGRSTVLSGTLLPEDVESRPARSKAPPRRYCLLEADDETLVSRLRARLSPANEKGELKRILGLEPEEFIRGTLLYRDELRQRFEVSACDWIRLDTSRVAQDATLAAVRAWIEAEAQHDRLMGPVC